MKVLYVIEGDGGGAVTHVLLLARELSRRRIPAVVAFLTVGPAVRAAGEEGIDFVPVSKRFVLDPSPLWKLMRVIKRRRIDVVHTHTIRGNCYGRLAAWCCGANTACVTTVHSHIVDELRGRTKFGIKERLLLAREQLTKRLADRYICVSEKIRERAVSNGIGWSKISVIENSVNMPDLAQSRLLGKDVREEFGIGKEEIVVGIVGRLVDVKNHDLFLRSCARLCKQSVNMRFLVVGDGPLKETLIEKSKHLGLNGHVVFTGWRDDVDRILCGLDVFVICSIVEGFNVSVLEAMACGKPVVGTDVKGISEIVVPGQTGLLVPSRDEQRLAEAVLRLAENGEERTRMGLNGRRLVEERYSVKTMVDDTLNVYHAAKQTRAESRI